MHTATLLTPSPRSQLHFRSLARSVSKRDPLISRRVKRRLRNGRGDTQRRRPLRLVAARRRQNCERRKEQRGIEFFVFKLERVSLLSITANSPVAEPSMAESRNVFGVVKSGVALALRPCRNRSLASSKAASLRRHRKRRRSGSSCVAASKTQFVCYACHVTHNFARVTASHASWGVKRRDSYARWFLLS